MITPHNLTNHKLDKEHIDEWRKTGCTVVNNLLPKSFINTVVKKLENKFDNEMHTIKAGKWDFGSRGILEFPCDDKTLNSMTIHPNIIRAVKDLLQDNNILLSQSDIWPKYGQHNNDNASMASNNNFDQRIHMDYGNNMLVHPCDWNNPEAVAIIIYLSDEQECGGSTTVVPKHLSATSSSSSSDYVYDEPYIHMPGIDDKPFINNKMMAEKMMKNSYPISYAIREELYNREKGINYTKGTVLFYRLDTWHRGTPIKEGKIRYVQNLVFKRKNADWVLNWNSSVARKMYQQNKIVEQLIVNSTVEQRTVLGFPDLNSKYWTEKTLLNVEARYKNTPFDIMPYRNALITKKK